MINRYTARVQAGMRMALAHGARFAKAKAKVKPGNLGAGAARQWYQVCAVGDTSDGRVVTEQFLRHYVADFYARPEPGPVYLGHCDVDLPPGVEEPPARAWVLALHLEAGKLWALYELTPMLARQIKAGGYRYNSINGAMVLDDDGGIVGAEFYSVAVTNSPAVPGLVPMAASRQRKGIALMSIHDVLKEAIKELPDDASAEQVAQYIAGKMAAAEAVEGGPEPEEQPAEMDGAPAPGAEPQTLADEDSAADTGATAALQLVAEAMGTDLAAVVAAIQQNPAAVASALGGGAGAGEDAAQMTAELAAARLQGVEQQMERMRKDLAEARAQHAQTRISLAVEKGHILEPEAATLRKFSATNATGVLERLDEAAASPSVPATPPVVSSAPGGAGLDGDGPPPALVKRYFAALGHIRDTEERQKAATVAARNHADSIARLNTRGRRAHRVPLTD